MTFEESGLRFIFDSDWSGVKWDESAACKEIQKVHDGKSPDGVGAVDYVGFHRPTRQLYLMEVKNYRVDRKSEPRPLDVVMAHKILGTTAGLVGSARGDDSVERQLGQELANRKTPVNIVVWMEVPSVPLLFGRSAVATIKNDDLKRRIRWLGARAKVLIADRRTPRLPGLTVESLPGPATVRS